MGVNRTEQSLSSRKATNPRCCPAPRGNTRWLVAIIIVIIIGLTETKLFHFHNIFKNGGGGAGRGFKRTPSGSATEANS